MSSASNNILSSRNPLNFLEYYSYDPEDNEVTRVMKILAGNTNINNRACRPKKQVNHVGIQTSPEVDDAYIPWLMEAERKTKDFYVQLCNLKNTLYHSQNSNIKMKLRTAPSSSQIIRRAQARKYQPLHHLRSSGSTKSSGGKNESVDELMFDLIEDRINTLQMSALELQNSIPKVSNEKLDEFKDFEILESTTVKETSILKLKRSASSMNTRGLLSTKEYKSNTLSTIKESKFDEKCQVRQITKQLSQMYSGTGKSDNTGFVPKTKKVSKVKFTAAGTSRQPSNTETREICSKDLVVPTKDTGAIPKIRETRRKIISSSTVRTKKTDNKPIWR